ncbi:hypothetical protein BDA96_07G133000 [Sorghum bicolor]|jgi:hypothetical protein|uniref:VQ domain-containing protein n=2 Tax=Sorghum bicolor TaxID=4558 RepID=A0A921U9T0_SORBI|nr:endochitinase A-like [Sorghum bicolor]KAG0523558.1 hypothetical protein BDA96_07G133000 [Sorghum bicolor]OQU80413.1 hypothetical protein SORBI_3007G124301 [Sorghum bicolor]|eukprot:XP_021320206.1 endochitinase A-like [Sorghum bicolor]
MDSGNSGSLQSSSGGDDEFDSRCGADSSPLSALLRQPPLPSVPGFGGGSLIYGLQELRTPPLSQSHWCSTTTAPLPLTVTAGAEASGSDSPPSLPGHGAAMAASAAVDQADAAPAPPPRGSRKRARRASRRAPTTVLTTDTSNFRAMVQEFTGIPAPPFAGAATARSRFDHHLFPLRTTATAAGAGTASPATLPQYLLRPFAQKVQAHASSNPYPPSFTSPSTSSPAPVDISIAPASTTTPGTTTALASSSDSYHQLTAASTSALLGMQQDHGSNNYHSFHQSSSLGGDGKYAAHPVFDHGIAPPPPPSATRLQDPADFLGLTHHDVMVGSQGPHAHLHLHPRNGGDELSGLVGGASVTVTGAGGCKGTYSSTRPLLERNRRNPSAGGSTATTTTAPVAAATAGMRTQAGVVDSWVCTSD